MHGEFLARCRDIGWSVRRAELSQRRYISGHRAHQLMPEPYTKAVVPAALLLIVVRPDCVREICLGPALGKEKGRRIFRSRRPLLASNF